MLYTAFVKHLFRAAYGKIVPLPPGPDWRLAIVADGVGGLDLCGTVLRHEAAARGLPLDVRIQSWGHGFGRWHADLTNVSNRDSNAAAVAAEVSTFRATKPNVPVFLVGKSGGTGVIVKALEQLPEGSVDRAILLAPALSPTYDLSRALAAIQREIVVFWSPLDLIVLGLGTRIFGTIDRARTVSAGLVGFQPPGASGEPPPAAYSKLRQVKWGMRMASTMYWGGHIGPDSPWFIRKYVIPLLLDDVVGDSRPVSSRARVAPIT
jgi:pimeloyl-ACP methyl ester carboxylesterase